MASRKYAYDEMILTTTNNLSGYEIEKYIDVISVDKIFGLGMGTAVKFIGDIFSNFTGNEQFAYSERINEVKNDLKEFLKQKAYKNGANAVVGIDYETSLFFGSAIMVSISGTAVQVKLIEEL